MIFTITIIPDEPYYKEAYDELVSTLKLKKYEPYFAIIMILFGIGLYFFDTDKVLGIFPIIFSLIGVYELYKVYNEKNKWMKARLASNVTGQKIEMEFSDSNISHKGPFSNGEIKWEGIISMHKTKKGIILKPDNGISMYLPDMLFFR
ncbi:MAG: hypothetical protein IPL12_17040 [Bacteroidetes bacterium]|nr:hypothetical protein [Bacteroidota bacterium]